ncbi:MAG: PilN domain-containing protein [Candidatus Bipolaricaulia bacterium]
MSSSARRRPATGFIVLIILLGIAAAAVYLFPRWQAEREASRGLHVAQGYLEQGAFEDAMIWYDRVIQDFPESRVAAQATFENSLILAADVFEAESELGVRADRLVEQAVDYTELADQYESAGDLLNTVSVKEEALKARLEALRILEGVEEAIDRFARNYRLVNQRYGDYLEAIDLPSGLPDRESFQQVLLWLREDGQATGPGYHLLAGMVLGRSPKFVDRARGALTRVLDLTAGDPYSRARFEASRALETLSDEPDRPLRDEEMLRLEAELAELTGRRHRLEEAQQLREEIRAIDEQIRVIEYLEGLQIEWARVLNELVWALPSEMKVDRIEALRDATGPRLIVDGRGSSINRIIGGFMANLERSDLFETARLQGDINAAENRFPFSISLEIASMTDGESEPVSVSTSLDREQLETMWSERRAILSQKVALISGPSPVDVITAYGQQIGEVVETELIREERFWVQVYRLSMSGDWMGVLRWIYAVQHGGRMLNFSRLVIESDVQGPKRLTVSADVHSYIATGEDRIGLGEVAETEIESTPAPEPDFELALQNPFEDYFIPEPEPEIVEVQRPPSVPLDAELDAELEVQDVPLTYQQVQLRDEEEAPVSLGEPELVAPSALLELPPLTLLSQVTRDPDLGYDYNGYLKAGGRKLAIILKGEEELLLGEGDVLDDYLIVTIEFDRIILRRGDREHILKRE